MEIIFMENENWTSEFRGLFWGEGCADIQRYSRERSNRYFYRPRLRITMRADDRRMLEDIQQHLGGTITEGHSHPDNYKTRPTVTWTLANKAEIVKVCDMLLKANLPAKKLQQIKHIREAAYMRKDGTSHMSQAEYISLEELYELLNH